LDSPGGAAVTVTTGGVPVVVGVASAWKVTAVTGGIDVVGGAGVVGVTGDGVAIRAFMSLSKPLIITWLSI
jgi:hypothetical protein